MLRRTIRGIAGASLVLLFATAADAAPKIPHTDITPLIEPIELTVRPGFLAKCRVEASSFQMDVDISYVTRKELG